MSFVSSLLIALCLSAADGATVERKDVAAKHRLAAAAYKQKDYPKAQKLFRECIRLEIKLTGADHPNVSLFLTYEAMAFFKDGKVAEAKRLLEQSRDMQQKALESGQGIPLQVRSLMWRYLALVHQEQGNIPRTIPCMEKHLETELKLRRPADPVVRSTVFRLADYYRDERLHTRALKLLLPYEPVLLKAAAPSPGRWACFWLEWATIWPAKRIMKRRRNISCAAKPFSKNSICTI